MTPKAASIKSTLAAKVSFAEIQPYLVNFMFTLHNQGIQLTIRMVGREAACLLPAFKDGIIHAKVLVGHSFTQSVGLTQCTATQVMQNHFLETEAAAKDFIAMIKVKMEGQSLENILNMDQMPTLFLYHSKKMLDVKGAKMIHARA